MHGLPVQFHVAAAYRAVPAEHRMGTDAANKTNGWMDGWMGGWMEHTVHGLPVQSRVAAAYRAVPAAWAMILAHMVMDRNGANAKRG